MSGERARVLVVDDDEALAGQIRWALQDDYTVTLAHDRLEALAALERHHPDIVIADLCMPPDGTPEEGFRILHATRAAGDTLVVIMSGLEERGAALRAVAEGAFDFFAKPLDIDTLRVVVARAVERLALERENRALRDQLGERFQNYGLIGVSAAMQKVREAIRRAADTPVTVLLEGESGTGKELVARALHHHSPRRDRPFVAVHCAALPETLLEAELFGHEKGAFTGAAAARVGRFESADGGTLFLDEIACVPPTTQSKLLRVLETRTVERLGSNRSRGIDIRLVAASNEDLAAKVRKGEFREDLYYRLHVFPILLPPLRHRAEDVPILAEHFLAEIGRGRDLPAKRFTPDARAALMQRTWPGNVRELMNLIESLVLIVDGDRIAASDLPPAPLAYAAEPIVLDAAAAMGLKAAVDDFERRVLVAALARAGGVKAQAARELGLDASQMKYLVRKHGL